MVLKGDISIIAVARQLSVERESVLLCQNHFPVKDWFQCTATAVPWANTPRITQSEGGVQQWSWRGVTMHAGPANVQWVLFCGWFHCCCCYCWPKKTWTKSQYNLVVQCSDGPGCAIKSNNKTNEDKQDCHWMEMKFNLAKLSLFKHIDWIAQAQSNERVPV